MKQFLIKYKFWILLVLLIGTLGAFIAVNIQSCKNKVKTILTVPGYDSAYHRHFDSLRAADKNYYDSVFSRFEEKFQVYDSTLMKSDIRIEVRRQVYNELRKFKVNFSNEEIYNQYKESLKNEE